MRPVTRGMIQYESLLNGTIDLVDLARMNDFIDIEGENELRYRISQQGPNRG